MPAASGGLTVLGVWAVSEDDMRLMIQSCLYALRSLEQREMLNAVVLV